MSDALRPHEPQLLKGRGCGDRPPGSTASRFALLQHFLFPQHLFPLKAIQPVLSPCVPMRLGTLPLPCQLRPAPRPVPSAGPHTRRRKAQCPCRTSPLHTLALRHPSPPVPVTVGDEGLLLTRASLLRDQISFTSSAGTVPSTWPFRMCPLPTSTEDTSGKS